MATNFAGYLLASGNDALPLQYIDWNSYDSNPDQREEIKAERDDNTRNLIRVTASGRKTAIHFKTRENLNLEEKIAFQTWFYNHETDHNERKIPLTFWNEETNAYDSGDFYRPNMKFPIKKIEGNNIIYGAMEFDLIEY